MSLSDCMKAEKIKSRGYLFTFDDLLSEHGCETSIYAINGKKHIFLCDTYLGPKIIGSVVEYLISTWGEKPFIVFNSHSDWDHIWGNCFFKSQLIISHRMCREIIEESGKEYLHKFSHYQSGRVEILKPNITFEGELAFPEEGIKFFYTPGHTVDSSSCLDEIDRVLYAGDNLEYPAPYIQWADLKGYERTLEGYMNMSCDLFISGHSGLRDRTIVEENLQYIREKINNDI